VLRLRTTVVGQVTCDKKDIYSRNAQKCTLHSRNKQIKGNVEYTNLKNGLIRQCVEKMDKVKTATQPDVGEAPETKLV